jgi:hypothetical protein
LSKPQLLDKLVLRIPNPSPFKFFMAASEWHLNPGDQILRRDLHQQYGGRTQGGIGPSKSTANVLVFSDPVVAKEHGYFDDWGSDGCYHYTGEGQHGDQEMQSGNAAILRHKQQGRALRLFKGVRGVVEYLGEFETDDKLPYYSMDAPEAHDGPVRSVIVFRLRPLTQRATQENIAEVVASINKVELVPVEERYTERTFIEPSRQPYEAERRESKLVQTFRHYLQSKGYEVQRLQVLPAGEVKPIFSDLYVPEIPLLVEAKGTVERGSIRMALGQLLDYERFVEQARCAILVPSRPRPDIVELVRSAGVELYWPEDAGFNARL